MVESTADQVTAGEKKFLTFLINYVVTTNASEMQTNLTKLTKYMTDELDS